MFETTDPRGKKVVLKAKTWNSHIIRNHCEMYNNEKIVQKSIEDPVYILPDKDNNNRETYFNLCKIPANNSLSVLKVVVDFTNSTGNIVTAYPVNNIHTQTTITKGVIIYERE
jgi:hypothetical protein